jgi:hypothetical protein
VRRSRLRCSSFSDTFLVTLILTLELDRVICEVGSDMGMGPRRWELRNGTVMNSGEQWRESALSKSRISNTTHILAMRRRLFSGEGGS